uniref:Uncharacterized protein n=1 Tax=Spongospora subterranea TaxID=70186 RepID=A0A0H5QUP9_9EUKA|eukprot:CRZ05477.1 hypothetical protein [Spongospora subterranea]
MGDIEDTRSPIERFRLGNTLSVSDISSQVWCEMQTAFSLEQPRKRTAAMNAGIKRHEHLELEVHDIRNISIVTESDQWACRFLNMIFGIGEWAPPNGQIRLLIDVDVVRRTVGDRANTGALRIRVS